MRIRLKIVEEIERCEPWVAVISVYDLKLEVDSMRRGKVSSAYIQVQDQKMVSGVPGETGLGCFVSLWSIVGREAELGRKTSA